MRKVTLFLAALALMMFVASCGEKKSKSGSSKKKEYVFTPADSAEIKQLVGDFMVRVDSNDFRGAVEMLNVLKKDSVVPLTGRAQYNQARALAFVKGVKREMKHLILRSDFDNEVKIDITLFEKPEGDKRPNTTSFYLRPVRFEGKWYLTTKDDLSDRAEGVGLSEDEEEEEEAGEVKE